MVTLVQGSWAVGWGCPWRALCLPPAALSPEQRAWRVKRISGAYCTQMDLFTSVLQEAGMWRVTFHVGSIGLMPGLAVCLQPDHHCLFPPSPDEGTKGF